MKVSRHFIITVLFLLCITGGAYYFFTKVAFFDRVSAENLSQLDAFLFKNYSISLNLPKATENSIRVYCDPLIATSTTITTSTAYPCQNQNPVHKVVIGWSSSVNKYMTVMRSLGNEQLYWRNYPSTLTEDGDLVCKSRIDFSNYVHAVFGMDCVMKTEGGERLYSSTMFFQGEKKEIRSFVTVMNTTKPSSPQQVELELLALIAHLKEAPTKYRLEKMSFLKGDVSEDGTEYASSSSSFSTEAEGVFGSYSSNTLTKNSGSGIDATVCDAIDTTSCYPLYCDVETAVWNYSLNKCIEPVDPPIGEKKCPDTEPVWDGSKCRLITGNIITSNTCLIPTGESSCSMDIFWSVQSPKNTVEVRRKISPTERIIVAKGQSDTVPYTFQYQEEPYTIELYDGSELLNDGVFTTSCKEGGWEKNLKRCVNPLVSTARVSGEYYRDPGSFIFTCSNADSYVVRHADTGTIIATGTYSGEVTAPITKTGNYSVACQQGLYTSNTVARYYNAPPPPPSEISFIISPRTVSKNEKTILNWNIHFPRETCSLTAKVICKNDSCSTAQKDFEDQLNQVLESEYTDEVDEDGSRPIFTALKTVAPRHVDVDWMAVGQKTLSISYTTDFTLSCGKGMEDRKRVYIRTVKE